MEEVSPAAPVAPFVQQLFKMVGEGFDGVGRRQRFVIPDTQRFAADRCPVYFKHSNWTSFARMLNMYEFRRRKSADGALVVGIRTSRAAGPAGAGRAEEAGVFIILGGNRRARQVVGRGGRRAGSGVRRRLASSVPGAPAARRPAGGGERAAQGRARRRPEATRAVRPHDVLRRPLQPQTSAVGGLLLNVCLCSLAPSR